MKPKIKILTIRTGYVGTIRASGCYWKFDNYASADLHTFDYCLAEIARKVFGRDSL